MTHTEAVRLALLAVSDAGHRAWPRNVGRFVDPRGNVRKIGTKGEADIQGILAGGWALAIEVKTGRAVRTAEQEAWGRMWTKMGGCYVVARYSDSEDGNDAIRAAIGDFIASRARGAAA